MKRSASLEGLIVCVAPALRATDCWRAGFHDRLHLPGSRVPDAGHGLRLGRPPLVGARRGGIRRDRPKHRQPLARHRRRRAHDDPQCAAVDLRDLDGRTRRRQPHWRRSRRSRRPFTRRVQRPVRRRRARLCRRRQARQRTRRRHAGRRRRAGRHHGRHPRARRRPMSPARRRRAAPGSPTTTHPAKS